MEMSGQFHTPTALQPENEPLVLFGLKAGWVHVATFEGMLSTVVMMVVVVMVMEMCLKKSGLLHSSLMLYTLLTRLVALPAVCLH
jgi:hypothetical protein